MLFIKTPFVSRLDLGILIRIDYWCSYNPRMADRLAFYRSSGWQHELENSSRKPLRKTPATEEKDSQKTTAMIPERSDIVSTLVNTPNH